MYKLRPCICGFLIVIFFFPNLIHIALKYFQEGNVGEYVDCHPAYIAPINNSCRVICKRYMKHTSSCINRPLRSLTMRTLFHQRAFQTAIYLELGKVILRREGRAKRSLEFTHPTLYIGAILYKHSALRHHTFLLSHRSHPRGSCFPKAPVSSPDLPPVVLVIPNQPQLLPPLIGQKLISVPTSFELVMRCQHVLYSTCYQCCQCWPQWGVQIYREEYHFCSAF
jgi:hypothetical protein